MKSESTGSVTSIANNDSSNDVDIINNYVYHHLGNGQNNNINTIYNRNFSEENVTEIIEIDDSEIDQSVIDGYNREDRCNPYNENSAINGKKNDLRYKYNQQLISYQTRNSSNSQLNMDDTLCGGGYINGGNLNNCYMTPVNELISQNNSNITNEYYHVTPPYQLTAIHSNVGITRERPGVGRTMGGSVGTRSMSVSTSNTVSLSSNEPYRNRCIDSVVGKSGSNIEALNCIDYSTGLYNIEKVPHYVNGCKQGTFSTNSLIQSAPTSSPIYYFIDREVNVNLDNSMFRKESMLHTNDCDNFEGSINYQLNNDMINYINNTNNNSDYSYLKVHSNFNNANNVSYSEICYNRKTNQDNKETITSSIDRQNMYVSGHEIPLIFQNKYIQSSNNDCSMNRAGVTNTDLRVGNFGDYGLVSIVPDYNLYGVIDNAIGKTDNNYILNSNCIAANNNGCIINICDNNNANTVTNNNIEMVLNQGRREYFYENSDSMPIYIEKHNAACFEGNLVMDSQYPFQNSCCFQGNNTNPSGYYCDSNDNIPYKRRMKEVITMESGVKASNDSNCSNRRETKIIHINDFRGNQVNRLMTERAASTERIEYNNYTENYDHRDNGTFNKGEDDMNHNNCKNTVLKKKKRCKGISKGAETLKVDMSACDGTTHEKLSSGMLEVGASKTFGKGNTGYIGSLNNINRVVGDRNFYIVDFICEIPLNIRNLLMNVVVNMTDGSQILKNYSLGSLAMRRTGSLTPAVIKCFFNSFRDGISRLQSKTKRQEGRPFIFVINETKLSRPWVFCPNVKCIKRSKSSGKLKGRIKIYEYCTNKNKIILSPTFLKCARGFLTSDYYFCATLCPQQKYADHDSNFWGEDFVTGFGGNKIQEALEKDSESISGSSGGTPLIDYIIFCNSKHEFVATFRRRSRGALSNNNSDNGHYKQKQSPYSLPISSIEDIDGTTNSNITGSASTSATSSGVSTPSIYERAAALTEQSTCNSSNVHPPTPCSQSSKCLNSDYSNIAEESVYGDDIELGLVRIMTSVIRNLEGSSEPVVYASTEKCIQEAVSIDEGVGIKEFQVQTGCVFPVHLNNISLHDSNKEIEINNKNKMEYRRGSDCNEVASIGTNNSVCEFGNYSGDGRFNIIQQEAIPPPTIQKLQTRPHYLQYKGQRMRENEYGDFPCSFDYNDSNTIPSEKTCQEGYYTGKVELKKGLDNNSNFISNPNCEGRVVTGADSKGTENIQMVNSSNNIIKSKIPKEPGSSSLINSNQPPGQYYDTNKTSSSVGSEMKTGCLSSNSNYYNKDSKLGDKGDLMNIGCQINTKKSQNNRSKSVISGNELVRVENNVLDENKSETISEVNNGTLNKVVSTNYCCSDNSEEKKPDISRLTITNFAEEGNKLGVNGQKQDGLLTNKKNELEIVVGEAIEISGNDGVHDKEKRKSLGSSNFCFHKNTSITTVESQDDGYFNSSYDQRTPPPLMNKSGYYWNVRHSCDYSNSSYASSSVSSVGTVDMIEDPYINNKYETYSTGYTDEDSYSNFDDYNYQISLNFDPQDALLVESSTNWVLDVLLNKNSCLKKDEKVNDTTLPYREDECSDKNNLFQCDNTKNNNVCRDENSKELSVYDHETNNTQTYYSNAGRITDTRDLYLSKSLENDTREQSLSVIGSSSPSSNSSSNVISIKSPSPISISSNSSSCSSLLSSVLSSQMNNNQSSN